MSDLTCSIDGCTKRGALRGWCRNHYQQQRRHGAFEARPFYAPDATCSAPDCDRTPAGNGLCKMHWKRVRNNGSTELLAKAPWEPRFWDKVYPCPITGCWLWGASVTELRGGYGQFSDGGGRMRRAHIVAFELIRGPVPAGLVLDHLCRVTCCVNPDHLEPVTHGVNVYRGMAPGAISWRTNVCQSGLHELTPENTYVSPRTGRRRCRTCRLAYQREWYRRAAARRTAA